MKAKMKLHKLLSLLLALVMVVGVLPIGQVAYADDSTVDVTFTNGGNTTFTGEAKAIKGTAYECTIKPDTGYTLAKSNITVKCDRVDLNSEDWTYDVETGKLAIVASAVTANITIYAKAVDARVDVPTNLTWEGTTAKWDTVTGADKYRVILYASDSGVGSFTLMFNHDIAANSIDCEEYILPGMYYYFEVAAYNSANESDSFSGFASSDKKQMAGSIGTVTGFAWSGNTISWTAVTGATGYDVWVMKDGVQKGSVRDISTASFDLTSDITNYGDGTYYVSVRAYKLKRGNYLAEGNSPALGHTHHMTPVAANPATCTTDGNTAYYVCSGCSKWFEDATGSVEITDHSSVVIGKLGHDWVDATCTAPKTCSRCDATEGTALGHDFADVWSSDASGHWHACSRCDAKDGEAAHTPDREAATETDPIKCSECDYIITAALGHTHSLTKVEAKAPTCTEDGNIEYYTCSGCSKLFADATGSVEITDTTSVIIPATNHTPSDDWKSDADNHWKECTVVGCGVIIENSKEAHTASDWITDTAATATTDGTKHKECNICHRVLETGTIPATGSGEHTHSYGSDWKSNADKHWKECPCGDKSEEAAHTASDWITDTAATATTDGTKHKECTVCHRVLETGTIPATGSVVAPKIIEGDGVKVTHGEKTALSFRSDADFSDFIRVEIDGKTLDTKNYTVKEGSTIVTLNGDYVSTLSVGTHTISVVSKNGTATATFTVKAKQTTGDKDNPNTGAQDDVPQTGDNSNMILWIVLLLASGLGVTGTVVYSKRKKYVK